MPAKNKPRKQEIGLTILGSGTCVPSLDRSSCAMAARINETYLLFDLGAGTTRRLLEAGITIFDVSYLFLTHFHPDHSGELASFLFSLKYAPSQKPPPLLTIIGGKGLIDFYEGLKNVFGQWVVPDHDPLRLIEMNHQQAERVEFEVFSVTSTPMKHNEESVAFKISNSDGVSFVYSGDTDFNENLIELSRNTDLLVCESSHPDGLKVKGHLTPSLAGEIARRAGVRQLVLTHFYPPCDEADLEKECRKTYEGPLMIAYDLMKINLVKQ